MVARRINYLRISLTQYCNYSCIYCKSGSPVKQINLFSPDEFLFIIQSVIEEGIDNIRFTGGEPLAYPFFKELSEKIKNINANFFITTNGFFLDKFYDSLKHYKAINISLNTLNKEQYKYITGVDALDKIIYNINNLKYTSVKIKINTVLLNDINTDQIIPLIDFSIKNNIPVRFIEFMPTALNKEFKQYYFSNARTREIIEEKYGILMPLKQPLGNGPAEYYTDRNKSFIVGFISYLSHPFCDKCNRIRILSDGTILPCLISPIKFSATEAIKSRNKEEFKKILKKAIKNKPIHYDLYHIKKLEVSKIGA